MINLFDRVKRADDIEELRHSRVVIICATRTAAYDFLENTASGFGHALAVFTDGTKALEWLSPSSPTAKIDELLFKALG
jgi:hypothetical protein